mmetsp:Transcript_104636/g.223652  ORF Transcript_104636/g.223652 Transcript_104636/m.223652 type:complete len:168 (-) Transcript_104636:34-537(-)
METLVVATVEYLPSSACINVVGTLTVALVLCIVLILDCRKQARCHQENCGLNTSALPRLSLASLNQYDGESLPLIYCCLRGRIYDVSSSGNFSLGASYAFLAGADATVGMAKMSLDRKFVNSMNFAELTADEWLCLDGWVSYMDKKYKCVGILQEYEKYVAEARSSE